jgi:hypothetical protein
LFSRTEIFHDIWLEKIVLPSNWACKKTGANVITIYLHNFTAQGDIDIYISVNLPVNLKFSL